MPRLFTLEMATVTLEFIRPLMEEVVEISRRIIANQPEIWPAIEKSAGNGGNPTLSRLAKDFDHLDDLIHQVQATGAIIKDIATGLLDFPALRNEQEVYLCWKVGEDGIAYWHEIEAGFAGRQSMDDF
ncbi:MAG: DUF2203 domain-containing protein [Chloroflexi bacterium]|nr:DUF2203 domain-containing protein [Chloroflexota bacterium]